MIAISYAVCTYIGTYLALTSDNEIPQDVVEKSLFVRCVQTGDQM